MKTQYIKTRTSSKSIIIEIVVENNKQAFSYKQVNLFSMNYKEQTKFKEYWQKHLPPTLKITNWKNHVKEIFRIVKQKHLLSLSDLTFDDMKAQLLKLLLYYTNNLV